MVHVSNAQSSSREVEHCKKSIVNYLRSLLMSDPSEEEAIT
jgi:hypothetical protein